MAEEIKISISKKSLTYYTLCFIIIILSLFTGYRIGRISLISTQKTLLQTQPSHIIHHTNNTSSESPIAKEHQSIAGERLSDPSWDNTTPAAIPPESTASESTVNTYRYYDIPTESKTKTENTTSSSNEVGESLKNDHAYVASKNGTKYYPADCKSADRIKPENRIYFATTEEAELEGLTRTTTCK